MLTWPLLNTIFFFSIILSADQRALGQFPEWQAYLAAGAGSQSRGTQTLPHLPPVGKAPSSLAASEARPAANPQPQTRMLPSPKPVPLGHARPALPAGFSALEGRATGHHPFSHWVWVIRRDPGELCLRPLHAAEGEGGGGSFFPSLFPTRRAGTAAFHGAHCRRRAGDGCWACLASAGASEEQRRPRSSPVLVRAKVGDAGMADSELAGSWGNSASSHPALRDFQL